MMAAFETSSAQGPCPSDEELAAFLDGMLSEAERARIAAHLADCESCYEIFAGALHFQLDSAAAEEEEEEPEGKIVLFPSNKDGVRPARGRRWKLPAAAAAVLVLGLGLAEYGWLFARNVPAAELAGSLAGRPGLDPLLYNNAMRGGSEETPLLSEVPAFMTGVHLVDLHLSLAAQDGANAEARLRRIYVSLRQIPGLTEVAEVYRKDADEVSTPQSRAALRRLAAALPARESVLEDSLSSAFAFGKWTEAGRLSAATQTPEFFHLRNRIFLWDIRRDLEKRKESRPVLKKDDFDEQAEREDQVLDELSKIAALWDRGKLQPADYQALAADFNSIIRRYDT
jgi:hypothetical protein